MNSDSTELTENNHVKHIYKLDTNIRCKCSYFKTPSLWQLLYLAVISVMLNYILSITRLLRFYQRIKSEMFSN